MCFVYASMDSFSEGGANVAFGKVEVSSQVAKVGDNFNGVVDVVPD